jgi:hypothetical protein
MTHETHRSFKPHQRHTQPCRNERGLRFFYTHSVHYGTLLTPALSNDTPALSNDSLPLPRWLLAKSITSDSVRCQDDKSSKLSSHSRRHYCTPSSHFLAGQIFFPLWILTACSNGSARACNRPTRAIQEIHVFG